MITQVIECLLREHVVTGSKPCCAIPKALKMILVATILGAQHYKASTGFSSLTNIAQLTSHNNNKKHNKFSSSEPVDVPLGGEDINI